MVGDVVTRRRDEGMKRTLAGLICLALVSLAPAAGAQTNPFRLNRAGAALSPEDNRLLFSSVERLNAAEPARPGLSESWSNPDTKSSGTSTLVRITHAKGQPCHVVQHHIAVAGRQPTEYRLTWCRTAAGEWKIK
jgi:surface antigen